MATSSVVLPVQADEEAVSGLLNRVRGLVAGVGSSSGPLDLGSDVHPDIDIDEGLGSGNLTPRAQGNHSVSPFLDRDEVREGKRVEAGSHGEGFTKPSTANATAEGRTRIDLSQLSPGPLHRHTRSGRIAKPRHHNSNSSSFKRPTTPATDPAAIESGLLTTPKGDVTESSSSVLAAAAATLGRMARSVATNTSPSSSSTTATASTLHNASGDGAYGLDDDDMNATASIRMETPVLSFWGPDPVPLPTRFANIKRKLIQGHEAEIEASWRRLITALRAEVDHIEGLGAHLIPSIEFTDIQDPAQTSRFGHDLRRYGVGVIRKVVPKSAAEAVVRETVQYLESKRRIKSSRQDPTCFDFYWTPAQVRSRAHPNVLRAQRFMMGLWDTSPDDRLVTQLPITYVDRIRIHGDDEHRPHGVSMPPVEPPQSADDWINALQSSAGIIAQVDNGSLERWEPDGYERAGTYKHIFEGRWEDHDPWECASRASATLDLYNGHGACTIFRMFQGVLALSTIEPGIIRLLPSPKLAAAYYLLRPFFTHCRPPPACRSGPAWDAYLSPDNWRLERNPDTIIYGAVPGHAQRITEHWHPHLSLRGSMITLPTLQPGDYILWHPDLPYHISSSNPGLRTPSSCDDDISMLVYIPAAPLTQTNALYLARQRKAFQRGHPGPDFDSTGRGSAVEDAETRPGEKEIAEVGGTLALRAMGLAPWEEPSASAETEGSDRPKGEDVEMTSDDTPSFSRPEAEVVRLANLILFPDRSMNGYSI